MPRFKKIGSLYKGCLKIIYNKIFEYCCWINNNIEEKDSFVQKLHQFLAGVCPTSVLDDLLEFHANHGECRSKSLTGYYFYRAVLHKNIRSFTAKNYNIPLMFWEDLFANLFQNLISLNLALSCNNQLLELIPKYCPNLENLVATCRYERIESTTNACIFSLSVTDLGLEYLCQCKKLKTIIVNEPRSNSRGIRNSITYAGLRRLLINVPTLEDVFYSDLGSVVCQGLEKLQSLNLKTIRHFNATSESIREILRLCNNLNRLCLTFFNANDQSEVWLQIIKANLKLNTLEVMNLNCKFYFSDIFRSIGPTLVCLSISNALITVSFSNIITIGRFCPNLTYLGCDHIVNDDHNVIVNCPENFGQLSQLISLNLSGDDMDLEKILKFCTENAVNLTDLRVLERGITSYKLDKIFVNIVRPLKLQFIEVSAQMPFTTEGIRRILERYPQLKYLSVSCTDDCRALIHEIRSKNYDLVFLNKNLIPFQHI